MDDRLDTSVTDCFFLECDEASAVECNINSNRINCVQRRETIKDRMHCCV